MTAPKQKSQPYSRDFLLYNFKNLLIFEFASWQIPQKMKYYFTSSKITIYENQLVMILWYKYGTDKRS
jgi:hypothetical protein